MILDLVGGADLCLDVDAHILHHPASLALTRRIFALGNGIDQRVFGWDGRRPAEKVRYIISEQYPLMLAGLASCLLIDLDYTPWHTQGDRPEAMSGRSLATVAEALERYLLPAGG